jgi:multiple sugar transport system ATP-binding protein
VSASQSTATTPKEARVSGIEFRSVTMQYENGPVALDGFSLKVEPGEFVVFVGPSGCGKSTALRLLAGLEEPTSGEIIIGERDVTDLDPQDRDLAMVFQSYALYPHKSVYENLAYPLRVRRTEAKELERRVRWAADLLGLGELLERRPQALSGGQRQRVAMGRALVREPVAFLMDEPLSNLDARLRVEMRAEIRQLQQRLQVTTIYVTHDQVEAMTMGDRVAVLKDGLLQQFDSPTELYENPVNIFVAGFIGSPAINLAMAEIEGGMLRLGSQGIQLGDGMARVGGRTTVVAGIRPEAFNASPEADDDEVLHVTPTLVERLGSETLVHFEVDAAPARTEDTIALADGEEETIAHVRDTRTGTVWVARLEARVPAQIGQSLPLYVSPGRLFFFDADSGATLTGEDGNRPAGAGQGADVPTVRA